MQKTICDRCGMEIQHPEKSLVIIQHTKFTKLTKWRDASPSLPSGWGHTSEAMYVFVYFVYFV